MMTACKCKICDKPITVEVDDDYAKESDPFKLIKMATCNRCYDMRAKREALHDNFMKLCCQLMILTGPKNQEKRDLKKIGLTIIARKYARLLCEYGRSSLSVPVDSVVNQLMENPGRCMDGLRAFRQEVKTMIRADRQRNPALREQHAD